MIFYYFNNNFYKSDFISIQFFKKHGIINELTQKGDMNMTLSDYLYKFEGNNVLKLYLDNAMKSPEMYVEVKKKISGYEFIPTQLFWMQPEELNPQA